MPLHPGDDDRIGRALLLAAGIPASDEEVANFETAYPILRAQADGLYLPFLALEEPAFDFSAAFEDDVVTI